MVNGDVSNYIRWKAFTN